jgi:CBS domain-containing protein
MKTVRDILEVKGRMVWSVNPGSTVFDALSLMAEKEMGALVVLDEARVAGIISERDYACKVILHGRASPTTRSKRL